MTENERMETIRNWMSNGFRCSQVMIKLASEQEGAQYPELIRAMAGLGGGMTARRVCGALTGGCCLLALYAEGAEHGEPSPLPYKGMNKELVEWFESKFSTSECAQLLEITDDDGNKICPALVHDTYMRIVEMLKTYAIALPE